MSLTPETKAKFAQPRWEIKPTRARVRPGCQKSSYRESNAVAGPLYRSGDEPLGTVARFDPIQ